MNTELRIANCGLRIGRRLTPVFVASVALLAGFLFSGCIGQPWNPAATQPVTEGDLATTQPSYWLSLPPTTQVSSPSFSKLWDAAEETIKDFFFKLDRREYRSGLLTSEPTISKQFYEFWRHDAPTNEEVTESTIAPIRRTIYFQFTRNPDGSFTTAPRVLVERYTKVEQKLHGTLEFEPIYWYPIRRDVKMERALGAALSKKMAQ